MVHRAPDSRLLNNLIAHEKEYTKHLSALFPISHTALASLSVYTAAYPSSSTPLATPQTLTAVVDVLATADDALQRYNKALEAWREQLVSLKNLEDDLGAILRDRDILVTRLIKASKSTKSRDVRSSLLIPPGSASFSSLPSTISSSHTGTSNSKLAQAQAELQACEAHLSSKERELEARRIAVAREGLGARCRALIDCGWVWGEMGKQGLQALQALSGTGKNASKPLSIYRPTDRGPPHHTNNPTSYASDNSSLTPSQSASQIAPRSTETSVEGPPSRGKHPDSSLERTHTQRTPAQEEREGEVMITLPAAHAISELAFPTIVRSQSQRAPPTSLPEPGRNRNKRQRRPPSQHIAEVDEDEGDALALAPVVTVTNPFVTPATPFPYYSARANDSTSIHDSSDDDDHSQGPLEIIENDPFSQMKQKVPHSPSSTTNSRRFAATPSPQLAVGKPRERKASMAFFGSIRGLFRHKPKERGSVEWEEGQGQDSPTRGKPRGGSNGWVTRTDARLKSTGRGDSSDEEDVSTPRASVSPSGHATGSKLRKGRLGVHNGSSPGATPGVDGWMTDSATMANRRETINRKKKKSVADLRGGNHGHSDNEVERRQGDTPRENGGPVAQASTPQTQSQSQQSAKAASFNSLARRSSSSKGSVTPVPTTYSPRRMTTDFSGGVGRTGSKETTSPPRDSVSVSASETITPTPSHVHVHIDANTVSKSKPKKDGSKHGVHYANGSASQSLMSIVADVTRQNREGWATAGTAPDGSSAGMQVPKAPSLTTPVLTAEHQKTRSLDIPRAPVNVVAVAVISESQGSADVGYGLTQPQAKAHGHGHHRSASTPAAHDVVSSSSSVGMNGTSANQTNGRALPKLPLRSALRNSSRTPSPSPARFSEAGTQREVGKVQEAPVFDTTLDPVERGRSPSLASISSYVTVKESFEDDLAESEPDGVLGRPFTPPLRSSSLPPYRSSLPPPPRTSSPPPRTSSPPFSFPPPPVESPPPQKATHYVSGQQEDYGSGSAPPSSTVSMETVPRRKSVRVSLPPTFSPTPPATYDDDATYEPWSEVKPPSGQSGVSDGGWKMRNGDARVGDGVGSGAGAGTGVWEDSSEEDATYARARKLLTRVGKKEKERNGGRGKGKGKGRA